VPELPEVETVRRGLVAHAVGCRISAVEISGTRTLRRHAGSVEDFVARLSGRTITAARRRGKFLWLPLDDGAALIAHLGMSGQFRVHGLGDPAQPHVRARLVLEPAGPHADRRELRFIDQRTFGGLALADDGDPVPSVLGHVAPDPLEPAFDSGRFSRALRHRRTGIKRALLDQRLISGVGNIYADEALWRAQLHWARATDRLRPAEVRRLLNDLHAVLVDAIAAGGTSFDALYVAVNGESGWFDRSLDAYGRVGQPCRRCGQFIVRERFTNRSSYRCPRCQPTPRTPRW
jgi:formamidopyrimidine-DNA glycosylase